jgi:hypothetical protein
MNERPRSTDRGLTTLANTDLWTISTDPTWRGEAGFWVEGDQQDRSGTESGNEGGQEPTSSGSTRS